MALSLYEEASEGTQEQRDRQSLIQDSSELAPVSVTAHVIPCPWARCRKSLVTDDRSLRSHVERRHRPAWIQSESYPADSIPMQSRGGQGHLGTYGLPPITPTSCLSCARYDTMRRREIGREEVNMPQDLR